MSQVEFRTNWPSTATPRASSSWPTVSWAFQINLGLSQKTLHYWRNKPRLYRSLQSTGEPQTMLWFSSTPRGMCADLWICGTGTHRWACKSLTSRWVKRRWLPFSNLIETGESVSCLRWWTWRNIPTMWNTEALSPVWWRLSGGTLMSYVQLIPPEFYFSKACLTSCGTALDIG